MYDEVEKARLTAKYERHIQRFEEMVAAINAMFGFHIITIEQKDDLLAKVQGRLRRTRGMLHMMHIPIMTPDEVDKMNARINEDINRRKSV